ncbi:MAG: DUF4255 domain-containing protein [Okeania sp. SIO2D1]|nr:DUF4255 domain-containing protein [Okeania sp. SIO2D1]
MIRDLSQALRRILEDSRLSSRFPELAEAQISFERPSETFSPGQTTVNLFLYDIREHLELRSNEPTIERRNGQAIIHNPPKRIACSYLVTAWPVGGEELPLQEHRLLGQVLQVFSAYPTIPEIPFLENTRLAGQEPSLPLVTAQVDGVQSVAELWTALGNQLRPSITVTVTVSMKELFEPEPTPIVITQDLQLGQKLSPSSEQLVPGTEQRFFRIGGQVTDTNSQPVVGATVILVEPNLTAATDGNGQYSIGAISAGAYTLRVQLGDLLQEVNITIPVENTESNYNVELPQ